MKEECQTVNYCVCRNRLTGYTYSICFSCVYYIYWTKANQEVVQIRLGSWASWEIHDIIYEVLNISYHSLTKVTCLNLHACEIIFYHPDYKAVPKTVIRRWGDDNLILSHDANCLLWHT